MNGKIVTSGDFLANEIQCNQIKNSIGKHFFNLITDRLYPLIKTKNQYLLFVQDSGQKNKIHRLTKRNHTYNKIECRIVGTLEKIKLQYPHSISIYVNLIDSKDNSKEFELKTHDICDYEITCSLDKEEIFRCISGINWAIRCFADKRQWTPAILEAYFSPKKKMCTFEEIYESMTEEQKNKPL